LIRLEDVKDLTTYERVREAERARIIEVKKNRRVSVGENLTLLFENRETVLFQIQEMIRTERIVDPVRIQDEIDAYRPLLPAPGELSATLFIEIPELPRMSQEAVRQAVNRFQGLERETVFLDLGGQRVPARFEEGHTSEEKMSAVHYVRFALGADERAALSEASRPVRIVVEHPNYQAAAAIGPGVRAELLRDLS
jgi:hypothetical protein